MPLHDCTVMRTKLKQRKRRVGVLAHISISHQSMKYPPGIYIPHVKLQENNNSVSHNHDWTYRKKIYLFIHLFTLSLLKILKTTGSKSNGQTILFTKLTSPQIWFSAFLAVATLINVQGFWTPKTQRIHLVVLRSCGNPYNTLPALRSGLNEQKPSRNELLLVSMSTTCLLYFILQIAVDLNPP